MTFFAFGPKCGCFGASGFSGTLLSPGLPDAASNPSFSSEPSATVPMPVPQRLKNWRRVTSFNISSPNFKCGAIYMASEFKEHNNAATQAAFANACRGVSITFESHVEFKKRVAQAIGLIRTGDGTLYGNMILVSS